MIDPQIALSVKPVENQTPQLLNIIQQGRQRQIQLQQLQMERETHAQQMQLNQQRIQEGQTAVQKAQVAARDQQLGQQGAIASGGDHDATLKYLRENNASPEYQMAYEKHVADLNQTNAKTDSDRLATKKDTEDRSAQIISQATDALKSSPETFPELWATQLRPAYEAVNPKAKDLPADHVPTESDLNGALARHATQQFSIAKTEEQRKASAETRAMSEFENKTETESRTKDAAMLANAAQQGPQALAAALQGLSEAGRVQPFMNVTSATKPADILKIGQTANEQVTTGQAAANAVEASRHNRADEAQAGRRTAIEQSRANLEAQKYEAEYGAGSDQRLVGVTPGERKPAVAEQAKVEQAHAKETSLNADVDQLIQAAKAGGPGSQEAGAQLGRMLTGELNGTIGMRRMNPADATAASQPGSSFQNLMGRLSRVASGGAPMTPEVLADVEKFNQSLKSNADARRMRGLEGVDTSYRSHFSQAAKSAAPQAQSQPAASAIPDNVSKALKGTGPGIHTLSDGSKWMVDAGGKVTKQ